LKNGETPWETQAPRVCSRTNNLSTPASYLLKKFNLQLKAFSQRKSPAPIFNWIISSSILERSEVRSAQILSKT
jgi:hypothetical protein